MRRIDGVLLPDRFVGRVRAQLKVAEVPLPQRRLGLYVRADGGRDELRGLEGAREIGGEDGDGPFSHNRFERLAGSARLLPARRVEAVLEPRAAVDAADDDAGFVRFATAVPQSVVLVPERLLPGRQEQLVPL